MTSVQYRLSKAPPSTNGLFFNLPTGGRAKTKRYEAWQKAMGQEMKTQGPIRTISGPVFVDIGVRRTNARRDLDNCLKAPLDLLVWMNVIEDDSQIVRITAAWEAGLEGTRLTIRETG